MGPTSAPIDIERVEAKTIEMQTSKPTPSPIHVAKIPLGFARSALFAVGRFPPGTIRKNYTVPMSMPPKAGATLTYTGPQLSQHHALAWQAVLYIAVDSNITDEEPLSLAADDLLRVMGSKGGDSKQRARAVRWLVDLANARVAYHTSIHQYEGPLLLLDCTKGKPLTVRRPPGLPALLFIEVSHNDLGRKAGLGLNALALWLHDYIATHQRPPPYSVEQLRQWCGSGQSLVHFRHDLRKALRLLAPTVPNQDRRAKERGKPERVPAPEALVLDWRIDRADRLHITKAWTRVYVGGASPCKTQEQMPEKVETAHERGIRLAREQRAKTAL